MPVPRNATRSVDSYRDFRCLVGPWCNFYPAGVIFAAHPPSHLDAYKAKKALQALGDSASSAGSVCLYGKIKFLQVIVRNSE